MILDHSSPAALVRDLNLHQGGLFRFEWPDGNGARPPWRLVSAATTDSAGNFCFLAEHLLGPGFRTQCAGWFDCGLQGLHIVGLAGVWVVRMLPAGPPPCGGSSGSGASLDDSQHDQLDKNLRGVFA